MVTKYELRIDFRCVKQELNNKCNPHSIGLYNGSELRDFYPEYCFTVPEMLSRLRPQEHERFVQDFHSATLAFTREAGLDSNLRGIPYVTYDYEADNHSFIFKLDNNGSTYLVRCA